MTTELIEKLEKASEGSRELDFYIARAVGELPPQAELSGCEIDEDYGWCWKTLGDCILIEPRTTSLDAALTLNNSEVARNILFKLVADICEEKRLDPAKHAARIYCIQALKGKALSRGKD